MNTHDNMTQKHGFPGLADWLKSEIAQLGENLTKRYKLLLEDFVAEVNRESSLDLVIDIHDGGFFATVNDGDDRTKVNFTTLYVLEQVNPDFASRLQELINAYGDLGGRIEVDRGQPMVSFGIDKSVTIHVGQEPASSIVPEERGDEPGP